MYAPPGAAVLASGAATWRYDVSLEMTLSEKNGPSGSDSERTSAPNADPAGAAARGGWGTLAGGAAIEPRGVRALTVAAAEGPGASAGAGAVPQAARTARSGRKVRGFMSPAQ